MSACTRENLLRLPPRVANIDDDYVLCLYNAASGGPEAAQDLPAAKRTVVIRFLPRLSATRPSRVEGNNSTELCNVAPAFYAGTPEGYGIDFG